MCLPGYSMGLQPSYFCWQPCVEFSLVLNLVLRVWEAVSFQFEDIREEDCQRGIHRGAWAILHNEFSKFGSVFGELLARGIEWRVTYRVLWSLFFRSIKF